MPKPLSLAGSALALLFWLQSLTPTLIPRSWQMQVAIGATCLAIGYGIGALARRCVRRLFERSALAFGGGIRRRSWMLLLAVAWLVGITVGATLWGSWQNEQRDFMGMSPITGWDEMLMGVLSPVVGALLVVVGRAIADGAAASVRFIRDHVPVAVSVSAAAVLIVVLGILFVRGVPLSALAAVLNTIHGPVNEQTTEGTVAPESSSVSGSKTSLVAWDTLGRMGRDFVAAATTEEQLRMFHGADAEITTPVRIYVGVGTADSAAVRAELAVRELERAGGFERKVLVVWIPTGTGWMVPNATAALELLHRGDTAIVGVQYSFLPSIFAVFVDAGLANEAGLALFSAVRARWLELPRERRPKLILFGKSLGTAGVEAPFVGPDAASSVANMVARTDGVLMAGAQQNNPIRSQLAHERDPGSPVWQPVFDGGRSVRFLNRDPYQPALDAEWTAPRIVYLQHTADPVVLWSIRALWWPPSWMAEPRGFGVPEATRWFPIVSVVQAVGDMLDQLDPPPGFGHDYSREYVRGWACVVPPEGWTDVDTERLEKFVDELLGEESEP